MDSSDNFQKITFELTECREDERDCQNKVIQVISTAGTILGAILATSFFSGDIKSNNEMICALFCLSTLIFCTAICFITALGVMNVLRYHYIVSLEKKLSIINCDDEKLPHWFMFSSPLVTKNVIHLKSKYSILHYFNYSLAVVCAIIFCLSMLFIEYKLIKEKTIYVSICEVLLIIIIILSVVSYFYGSYKSKNIYNMCLDNSYIKFNNLNSASSFNDKDENSIQKEMNNKKNNLLNRLKFLLYFIFPKIKDLHKSFIIVLGDISAMYLYYGEISVGMIRNKMSDIIIIFVVFEFLFYQARYLYNDLRNFDDDKKMKRTDRIPLADLNEKNALIILLFIILRMMCAFLITLYLPNNLKKPLMFCLPLTLIITMIYEYSREKYNSIAILIFVSLGYPIRFICGMWCFGSFSLNIVSLMLLIFALTMLGEFSAVIPWLHEILVDKNSKKIKKHYQLLYETLSYRYDNKRKINKFTLRDGVTKKDFWVYCYILSMLAISIISLYTNHTKIIGKRQIK